MTSAIFDFKDIRRRMLGDNKPKLPCLKCEGVGWISLFNFDLERFGFMLCPYCENPQGNLCP